MEELRAVPHALGADAHGQLSEQRARPVQQPCLHQRREHRDVAACLRFAFVERAHAMADLEPDVPEEGEEPADRVIGVVRCFLEEDQEVDVGLRMQLAAAVAPDGDEIRRVEHLRGEVDPAGEDDLIDDLRAPRDESFDGVVAAEPFAEQLTGGFQRIAERLDGPDVTAQRSLECAAVDQRCRGWRRILHARQVAAIGRAQGQHLEARVSDEHRVLPLRRQGMILRHHRPAVREQLHVALARVDHRLDRYGHAGNELDAGTGPPVVQHLRVLVEDTADAMTAVLADDGEALLFDVGLNRVADVAEAATGLDRPNAAPHGIEANARQPLGHDRRRADHEHAARVAVVAVLDDGDIDVDDVAEAKRAVAGDAVTHDMVDRRADRLGERCRARRAPVVQRGGNRGQLAHDVLVTEPIELFGGDARLHVRCDHVEHLRCQTAGHAHLVLLFRRFDRNHRRGRGWAAAVGVRGSKNGPARADSRCLPQGGYGIKRAPRRQTAPR